LILGATRVWGNFNFQFPSPFLLRKEEKKEGRRNEVNMKGEGV